MDGDRRYILDASALYPLVMELREKLLDYIDKFVVLDLTLYEAGNTIWREYGRGRIKDLVSMSRLFEEIFDNLQVLKTPFKFSELVKLACDEGLTVYDASYLYVSRKHMYKLVTEDNDLKRYPESIDVRELISEITRK
jgi:predicted nucleic acid-binding protein